MFGEIEQNGHRVLPVLTEEYGEECMPRAHLYVLHNIFCEVRGDVEDDERCGRPSTLRTGENAHRN